jgi:hypothetical protein
MRLARLFEKTIRESNFEEGHFELLNKSGYNLTLKGILPGGYTETWDIFTNMSYFGPGTYHHTVYSRESGSRENGEELFRSNTNDKQESNLRVKAYVDALAKEVKNKKIKFLVGRRSFMSIPREIGDNLQNYASRVRKGEKDLGYDDGSKGFQDKVLRNRLRNYNDVEDFLRDYDVTDPDEIKNAKKVFKSLNRYR